MMDLLKSSARIAALTGADANLFTYLVQVSHSVFEEKSLGISRLGRRLLEALPTGSVNTPPVRSGTVDLDSCGGTRRVPAQTRKGHARASLAARVDSDGAPEAGAPRLERPGLPV